MEVIWKPGKELLEESNISLFMKRLGIRDRNKLIERSTSDLPWFWKEVSKELGIVWDTPFSNVLEEGPALYKAKWFTGGKLNVYRNCVEKHAVSTGKKTAVVSIEEDGRKTTLTYRELGELSLKVASFLHSINIKKGDRIGITMPMNHSLLPVIFGCFLLGCTVVPAFTGYGEDALRIRFSESGIKLVFTSRYITRRGKNIPLLEKVLGSVKDIPSVRAVISSGIKGEGNLKGLEEIFDRDWEKVPSQPMESEDEAAIIYTSGTTGRPKGTIHTQAGLLHQVGKDTRFLLDIKGEDRVFWLTDIGWMAALWIIVGTMLSGSTLVMYSGAPDHPGPERIYRIVEEEGITILGTAPTLARMLKEKTESPRKNYNFSSLRIIGSGGEMWDEASYMWFFEEVGGGRCPIINMCGGTEVMGNLVSCLPIMELKPCTVGGPSPGMAADVVDENGRHIQGKTGYLVCRRPFPSMTRGFVDGMERFLESYFSKFPNVWFHGDLAYIDEDGLWFIEGRADDVIKVAGKRVGPGEIEDAVNSHRYVLESAAISIPDRIKGEVVVVLVKTSSEAPNLEKEIREIIERKIGKGFTIKHIVKVPDIPKTITGKIPRKTIRLATLGEKPDTSNVSDPELLDLVVGILKNLL